MKAQMPPFFWASARQCSASVVLTDDSDRKVVDIDAELSRIDRVERMFGIDEGADAALLLGFGQAVQRQRGLARRFGPIDLDDAAARQPADAERDIEAQRARGDDVDVHRLVVLTEPYDRALAKAALD